MSKEQAIAREFRDYAYSVSHDLGSHARAMVEFSRLLSTDHAPALNDEGRLYLSLIVENGEKMYRMMEGLLAYSRLNTMAQPFSRTDCNLLVTEGMLALQEKMHAAEDAIEAEALPVIQADAGQMRQLFLILLDNALKFRAPGAPLRVKISASEEKDGWQFAVADNGIGMEPQFGERIFRLFQRLHPEEEYPGAGIGLALAQKIVQRHGGRIWVETGLGRGSTFYFTIAREKSS